MRALVLAAGYGTRLWPLTADRAKPAVPFLGRPLLVHALSALARLGVREAAVNLHYRPESVRAALADLPPELPRVRFSEEADILGTAGAMDPLRDFLGAGPFLLVNGKVVCDLDLAPIVEAHRETGALATLVLVPNRRRERFREVLVGEGSRLAGFGAMPDPDGSGPPPLAFTGIQVLDPTILDYVPRGRASDTVKDVYPRALAEGRTLLGLVAHGSWEELSTPRRYLDAHVAARPEGFAAPTARVAPGARVTRSVLWAGARVEAGARLTEVVLAEGAVVPAGTQLAGGVAVRAEVAAAERDPLAAPGRAPRGRRVGDLVFVPFDDAGEAARV